MFYIFLISLIVLYAIYYIAMIAMDVQRVKKSVKVDDVGNDVDISSAVSSYIPIDSSDIINDDKDSQIKSETDNSDTYSQQYYETLADTTDYSDSVNDKNEENWEEDNEEEDDYSNTNEFLNQYTNSDDYHEPENEEEPIGNNGEPDIHGGGIGNARDLEEEQKTEEPGEEEMEEEGAMATHGGYYACDLEKIFKEEYERVGQEFMGMKVTSKN